MAKVEIIRSLFDEIQKRFKGESHKIIDLLETLEANPRKGKFLSSVGGIVLKEIRYNAFRFYFITDGEKLRVLDRESLASLLIKFIRMSDKKSQQKEIDEIKKILLTIGAEGFNL